jgi:ESCRT-I complex subunit TSG101
MFELVADDNAISDTVYFLAKALNSERIDLATFMKVNLKWLFYWIIL